MLFDCCLFVVCLLVVVCLFVSCLFVSCCLSVVVCQLLFVSCLIVYLLDCSALTVQKAQLLGNKCRCLCFESTDLSLACDSSLRLRSYKNKGNTINEQHSDADHDRKINCINISPVSLWNL